MARQLYGLPDNGRCLTTLADVFARNGTADGFVDVVLALAAGERRATGTRSVQRADGSTAEVLVTLAFAGPDDGDGMALSGIADITEIQRLSAALLALRNVVDKALKFSAHAGQPRMAIRAKVTHTGVQLSVQDNGIGFDMKRHDRIFQIFQRLQRAEDYPGTGVGLAIVNKAMARMGGRCWADSPPGQGATFQLRMPLVP